LAQYDIIMLVLNDLAYDGRVRREAASLAVKGWRVLVIGTQRADGVLPDCETLHGFEVRRVRYGRFGAGLWRPWRWIRHLFQLIQIYQVLFNVYGRAYHAHDLPALLVLSPLRLIRRHCIWIYDSHELYLFLPPYSLPRANRWHAFTRPLFMRLEGFLARRVDAVLTLCEARARLLAYWYSIPRPVVIHNIVDPVQPVPTSSRRRVIVHTGEITNRGRALTELIDALALLPEDCSLLFLGQGEAWMELQAQAARLNLKDRVFQQPPVAPDQVPEAIRSATVAVSLLRADSFNTRASIPNKLWEALAAGLPTVATDLVGQRRLGRRIGVLCRSNDPVLIAAALRQVLDAPDHYRAYVQAAQQDFSWGVESEKLGAIYRRLLECTS
jgi:glycosyltransferase involved in cell wall biosynthesis